MLDQTLVKLRNCLKQLDDQQVWWRPDPSLNSIGNLVLHMCGNLRQWSTIGLTHRPDDREREKEFEAQTGYSAVELLQLAEHSVSDSKQVIRGITGEQLAESFIIQGFEVSGLKAILHTTSHFVGHTHQIILMTRMQLGSDYNFAWSPCDGTGELPV